MTDENIENTDLLYGKPRKAMYLDADGNWQKIDYLDLKKGMKFMLYEWDGEQVRDEETLQCVLEADSDVFWSKYQECETIKAHFIDG